MKRLLLRGSAVGVVVATFITAGAVGATAIRSKVDPSKNAKIDTSQHVATAAAAAESAVVDTTTQAPTISPAPAPQTTASVSQPASAPLSQPSPAPAAPAAKAAAPLAPILPMGSSGLPDSVTAIRSDSDVVVSFDLMMTRTRKPVKFEQFVRATLPLIYGRGAREALAKIPDGDLATQGDLLTELPGRGMRIPVTGDWMIRLFPETRAGQDGPLVVRYRASVVPISR
jgi:hypothetical protein